ncbi:HIT family protein [Ktedonobacter sp. SOSP1-85]|uniref:HIT family protein n=1 Tax=Ktedonobacter sp. SOSP1-85 TaxID=2778367 RepID=UPI001915512D|nr:HIT family protein [Ktedonobacter sp. SOSP1-85]GHO77629.1 HIT family protein [Ktedonobacter sp. SOSP1-85]
MEACVFCQIVRGEAPCHLIWEDDEHLAFLSIFPNTKGFSVVIPKVHISSYAFQAEDGVLQKFILAAKQVALLLDGKFVDVGRTGLILEGFGVDHLHAKLVPMHGTGHLTSWQRLSVPQDKYFTVYEGYIASHDYKRADDQDLADLAQYLRS